MNIDWSKAPEGATHYKPTVRMFLRVEDGYAHFFGIDGRWNRTDSHISQYPQGMLIEREWNGAGLPPVGTVCEVLWNESRMEYLRTKVFGVNEHGQPIHRFDEGPKKFEYQADPLVTVLGTKVFRPIRTPEQIEAEEREKAVKVMLDLDPPHESGFGLTSRKTFCETLYDAGYRKQPKEGA